MDKIDQKYLEQFRKLGLIDEIALRNYYIRKDFKSLRAEKIKVSNAIRMLSKKYNRSESAINIIIYSKKGEKFSPSSKILQN